ncbi:MAG: RNA polymerase factor sigma-54 [Gammaproteobacteria bacterium]|nr:RNA polymerase factor sigma-54 [Gammaproteobacteria bacterium]
MKQSLQLRLGQQLTMTPQLQQAIKLLQLPTFELQNEIQQILESNPMLELTDEAQPFGETAESFDSVGENNTENFSEDFSTATYEGTNANDIHEHAPEKANDDSELPVSSDWESAWENEGQYSSSDGQHQGEFNGREAYENQDLEVATLHDHLLWQLNLSHFSDVDYVIATAIIDAINEDGYLTESLESLHAALQTEIQDDALEIEEIITVLHRIQHFDPIGVGARSAAECLLLQLSLYDANTPSLDLAKIILRDHLELLALHDYARLKKVTGATEGELHAAEILIQALNPKPGASVASTQAAYIVPDVFVTKRANSWRVELNPDLAPRLRINQLYANLIRRADKSDDNTYLKNNLQEARWFLKSLHSRNETILKVASVIVERQRAFLEYGDEAMKPLVLRDVADTLDMHESTISRVTNQKYMHTPRGIFELKHFFSSHVGTADGGECSSVAIRAMIKKLIIGEDTRKPLSDSKIAELLDQQGINVARRTVAKYREALEIPPSNERKRLI